MSSQKRSELMQDLVTQVRYMSVNFVMFSQAIANHAGIHPTDNECLDLLLLKGALTAGQLAELTGLTTGAVTAVIDRLEKTGFAKRERDAHDRRKVIVVPNTEKIYAETAPLAMKMQTAMEKLADDFSEAELETVLRFVTGANQFAGDVLDEVRKGG